MGDAPAKPEGAQWAAPLEVITDVTYRSDAAGYLKPGYTHAFVISAEGGAPRQLSFGAFNEGGPLSWSADGHFLIMSGNRDENWRREPLHTELYQVALADSSISALTKGSGPHDAPAVSPDGKQIAYLGFDDHLLSYQDTHLYVMARNGGPARVLGGGLDRSIERAFWGHDSKDLYIEYVDKSVTTVARVALDGSVQALARGLSGAGLDRPYTGGEFSVAANGAIAYTGGSAERPSELWVAYRGHSRQLTHLNENLLAGKTLARVQSLAVQSSFDQKPIDAWLVTPPNFEPSKKYPLILEIHGGPVRKLWARFFPPTISSTPRPATSWLLQTHAARLPMARHSRASFIMTTRATTTTIS